MLSKLRLEIALAVAFVLCGCVSARITADAEHRAARSAQIDRDFSNVSVVVVDTSSDPLDGHVHSFVDDLTRAKIFKQVGIASSETEWADWVITNVRDERVRRLKDFQCFEPLLTVFTAGLVPTICVDEYKIAFDV